MYTKHVLSRLMKLKLHLLSSYNLNVFIITFFIEYIKNVSIFIFVFRIFIDINKRRDKHISLSQTPYHQLPPNESLVARGSISWNGSKFCNPSNPFSVASKIPATFQPFKQTSLPSEEVMWLYISINHLVWCGFTTDNLRLISTSFMSLHSSRALITWSEYESVNFFFIKRLT